MSLDGRTATAPGDSPWISGEQSRELVHRWRAESDAIAVGIGTVLADDPLLTARDSTAPASRCASSSTPRPACRWTPSCSRPSTRRPVLVVVSPDADPTASAALRDAGAEILVADGIDAPPSPTSAAAASPASSSRAAEPSPPPFRRRPDRRVAYLRRPDPAGQAVARGWRRRGPSRGASSRGGPPAAQTRAPRP